MRTHPTSLVYTVAIVSVAVFRAESLAQPCPLNANEIGCWGDVTPMELNPPGQPTGRMLAVHSILLRTGKVLCIDQKVPFFPNTPDIVLFDPADGTITLVVDDWANERLIFCSGHSALSDGRIFFSGGSGEPGQFKTSVYVPDNDGIGEFLVGPNEYWCLDKNNCPGSEADTSRWYPTCTTLADGTILVTDGWTHQGIDYGNGEIPVILKPNAGAPSTWTWKPLYDAEYCRNMPQFPDPCTTETPHEFNLGVYAFMFLLKNASVFMAGSHHIDPAEPLDIPTRSLNPAMESWAEVPLGLPPGFIKGGSAVMYQSDKIMKAGGGLTGDHGDCEADNITNRVFTIDLNQDPPVWVEQQAMNHKRLHFYLIALPDGKILALGGSRGGECPVGSRCDENNGVLEPELYDPYAQPPDWTVMAPMGQPRQYHSSAVLLPDGSVFIAGGEFCSAPGDPEKTYQIYTPPYFHQGPRPTMTSWPPTLGYNAAYNIVTPDAEEITKVRLIRLGSATHSLDQDQRSLELSFTIKTASLLRIVAPQHGFAAPPGFYLLGIAKGVNGSLPSEGQIVQVGNVPA